MSKPLSKATRRSRADLAAERARAVRAEHERKQRRRRTWVVGVAIAAVLSAVIGVGWAVQASRDTTGEVATSPANVVDRYALTRGEASAPVTVEVVEDFLCSYCGQFEAAAGEMLAEYAEAGDVQVRYRMIAFLDQLSAGSDYSTRAMNAVAVVLDTAGEDAALSLHDLLFAQQPPEGTPGPSDTELIDMAVRAGADRAEVAGPIRSRQFEQWVKNATDQASRDGYTSTPTVAVDGKVLRFTSVDQLVARTREAIESSLAR